MKTFNLIGIVTSSVYTTVEAETLEQAIEIASKRSIEKSHWNSKMQQNKVWVNDEYDGEVQEISET